MDVGDRSLRWEALGDALVRDLGVQFCLDCLRHLWNFQGEMFSRQWNIWTQSSRKIGASRTTCFWELCSHKEMGALRQYAIRVSPYRNRTVLSQRGEVHIQCWEPGMVQGGTNIWLKTLKTGCLLVVKRKSGLLEAADAWAKAQSEKNWWYYRWIRNIYIWLRLKVCLWVNSRKCSWKKGV